MIHNIEYMFCFVTFVGIDGARSNLPSVCPKVVTKKKWGGLGSKNVEYQVFPVPNVIVHHTVTPKCNSKSKCSSALLNMQNYNMNDLGGDDIAYK